MEFYEASRQTYDRFFPKAIAQQIIGEGPSRKTKTFLPTKEITLLLSLVKARAESYVRLFQAMHEREKGVKISHEECLNLYETPRSWVEIHDELVAHFGSFDGFTIRMAVRSEEKRQEEEDKKRESSMESKGVRDSGTIRQ